MTNLHNIWTKQTAFEFAVYRKRTEWWDVSNL